MTAHDAPTSTPKVKVFISYAHADEQFVRQLEAELAKHGVNAWYDRKPQTGLRGGETWEERLTEALAIADRCEYRLAQADIHNFLARLALDAGNRVAAREQAEIAKERAWCDGPPHCYKPALEEAEGLLRELGAGE